VVAVIFGNLALDGLRARITLVPVFSLNSLTKNSANARPPSNSHVVSYLSASNWIASLKAGQSFVSPTEREIHWEAKTHRSFSSTNYC
jgi:hypothetical protein